MSISSIADLHAVVGGSRGLLSTGRLTPRASTADHHPDRNPVPPAVPRPPSGGKGKPRPGGRPVGHLTECVGGKDGGRDGGEDWDDGLMDVGCQTAAEDACDARAFRALKAENESLLVENSALEREVRELTLSDAVSEV